MLRSTQRTFRNVLLSFSLGISLLGPSLSHGATTIAEPLVGDARVTFTASEWIFFEDPFDRDPTYFTQDYSLSFTTGVSVDQSTSSSGVLRQFLASDGTPVRDVALVQGSGDLPAFGVDLTLSTPSFSLNVLDLYNPDGSPLRTDLLTGSAFWGQASGESWRVLPGTSTFLDMPGERSEGFLATLLDGRTVSLPQALWSNGDVSLARASGFPPSRYQFTDGGYEISILGSLSPAPVVAPVPLPGAAGMLLAGLVSILGFGLVGRARLVVARSV